MTAHHFSDHASGVGVACGAKAVHRVCCNTYGGVKTEGEVGSIEVIVDCLRHANDRDARVGEFLPTGKASFAADYDQGVNAVTRENLFDSLDPAVVEGVCSGGSQDRAAEFADALDLVAAERHCVVVDDTFPPVAKTDELVSGHPLSGENNASNNRIQTGGVATARQDSNSHVSILGVGDPQSLLGRLKAHP